MGGVDLKVKGEVGVWVGGTGECARVDLVMAAPGVGLLAPTSRVNSNASTKEDERTQLEKEALVNRTSQS